MNQIVPQTFIHQNLSHGIDHLSLLLLLYWLVFLQLCQRIQTLGHQKIQNETLLGVAQRQIDPVWMGIDSGSERGLVAPWTAEYEIWASRLECGV